MKPNRMLATQKVPTNLLVASGIGGLFCILADLLKADQSAIYTVVGLLAKLLIPKNTSNRPSIGTTSTLGSWAIVRI